MFDAGVGEGGPVAGWGTSSSLPQSLNPGHRFYSCVARSDARCTPGLATLYRLMKTGPSGSSVCCAPHKSFPCQSPALCLGKTEPKSLLWEFARWMGGNQTHSQDLESWGMNSPSVSKFLMERGGAPRLGRPGRGAVGREGRGNSRRRKGKKGQP